MMLRLRHVVFCWHVLGDDFASAADLVETIHKLQGERDQVTSIPDSRPVLPSSAASAVSEGQYCRLAAP